MSEIVRVESVLEAFGRVRRKVHKQVLEVAVQRGYFQAAVRHAESKGWEPDHETVVVMVLALGCAHMKLGGTGYGRPKGADGLKGAWPENLYKPTASQIVELLDMRDLLG